MNPRLSLALAAATLLSACGTFHTGALPRKLSVDAVVIGRTADLRALFRPEAMVRRLERIRACSVEPGGNISRRLQVPVGNGLALDEVVRLVYGHRYDGQIKVVSRDSIVQTSLANWNPLSQAGIDVHPGDLVFIEPRD